MLFFSCFVICSLLTALLIPLLFHALKPLPVNLLPSCDTQNPSGIVIFAVRYQRRLSIFITRSDFIAESLHSPQCAPPKQRTFYFLSPLPFTTRSRIIISSWAFEGIFLNHPKALFPRGLMATGRRLPQSTMSGLSYEQRVFPRPLTGI